MRESSLQLYVPVLGAFPISNFLFADDCLHLGRASVRSAWDFRKVLEDYYMALGQRVNLHKSKVHFSLKTHVQLRRLIRDILSVAEQMDAFRYLGVFITGDKLAR